MTLAEVNALTREAFMAAFGGVAEHSAWVAERAAAARPYADRAAMVLAFQRAVLDASDDERMALLRAHPDLAGRAALAGELTRESTQEQAGAGLDRLTQEEYARFQTLNDAYRARFGMPFIVAVRGATKHQILAAFENRVGGTREEETLTAVAQVLRIVRFRLEDAVAG
ncbi:2-oxo-4-hydroxy-4-carboxy-5-ureidoimidazoline decarboxylase [Alsobacter sp. SYSU M60028]|uniref:2-oxo-4-hydroxy-4-carboxy-5-ureidoimidazoline decarboxylase n=1 Tax=Alsobacter ponti TaxID=2962936 RepID=A0ABT1L9G4_9HYPH|nr:2-oxo-4-hydroxy-4-carboxy-5-ureidoimidazoline decarboxylase [Alsobacter ponti]MCP8937693.1 2-oxo-4-hydroxy-4-carboxy-5-ureidoimidazoline decarboxylase [Alsobacter ponti]